jgi:hypothetical protein
MLSFAHFVEARKVDPEALSARVQRRFGDSTTIPLSGYKRKVAKEVDAKVEKAYKSNKVKTSKKRFRIKDLAPTQTSVSVDNKRKLRDKIAETKPSHILTATHKGKHYILDGHHSVMAAKLRGDTHVDSTHIDLDS